MNQRLVLLKKIAVLLVLTIPLGACPVAPSQNQWNFLMGVRGGGRITFIEGGLDGNRAECAQPECRTTLEHDNVVRLTAIAGEHFTFKLWEGSIQERLPCLLQSAYVQEDERIDILIKEVSACIAVFEAEGPGSGTVPGGDD